MADYTQPDAATKRVRFFDGQFLQDQDFVDEQKYHLDRERRTMRELGIPGVLSGLQVSTSRPFEMTISPGTAVDPLGRYLEVTAPLVLTFPKNNVSQAFPVVLVYREVETDVATAGGQSATRFAEVPMAGATLPDGSAIVAPADADTKWDEPSVSLGSWTIVNGTFVAADAEVPAGFQVPGRLAATSLRVGPGTADPPSLLVDGSGRVGIGTTTPQAAVDVVLASSSRLRVRTGDATGDVKWGPNIEASDAAVDVVAPHTARVGLAGGAVQARIMAGDNGFLQGSVQPGLAVGTNTGHPLTLMTLGRPQVTIDSEGLVSIAGKLTVGSFIQASALDAGSINGEYLSIIRDGVPLLCVDSQGQIGVGTNRPNAGAFPRVMDLYDDAAFLLSVRAKSLDTHIIATTTAWRGIPAGQIIGTTTRHPVTLIADSTPTLTVSPDGQVGIGTSAPAALLDVAGTLQVNPTSTAATPALFVNNDGNVAIGTNAPPPGDGSRVLDVYSSVSARLSLRTSTVNGRVMASDATSGGVPAGQVVGTASNHPISFVTNNAFAMTITASGDVGIGTTGPVGHPYFLAAGASYDTVFNVFGTSRVQLRMNTRAIDSGMFVTPDLDFSKQVGLTNLPAAGALSLGTFTNHAVSIFAAGTQTLLVSRSSVSVVGDFTWTGNSTKTSDARLKTGVAELEDATGMIERLRGVRFSWTDEALEELPGASTQEQIGVIAQDVAAVLPELVRTGPTGTLAVDYTMLTAVLVQAVKELDGRLAELETTKG